MKSRVCLVLKQIIVIIGIKNQKCSSLLILQWVVLSLLDGKEADYFWRAWEGYLACLWLISGTTWHTLVQWGCITPELVTWNSLILSQHTELESKSMFSCPGWGRWQHREWGDGCLGRILLWMELDSFHVNIWPVKSGFRNGEGCLYRPFPSLLGFPVYIWSLVTVTVLQLQHRLEDVSSFITPWTCPAPAMGLRERTRQTYCIRLSFWKLSERLRETHTGQGGGIRYCKKRKWVMWKEAQWQTTHSQPEVESSYLITVSCYSAIKL